ncbi:MAG: tyrosine-type recombinase/integrase, partial [Dechloromonas sp.]|nr:tyrosine-type recombinase/integrase [Candidatus Dechloromonas phosphorivorans]
FHTLRHTSCSRLAQAGVDILAIAEHAGHRSLSMTRRYSHLCIKGRANTINSVFA